MTSSKADNPSPSEYETFPISVMQEAGEQEPGTIIMDAVNKCELTASAQMKHRKKGTAASRIAATWQSYAVKTITWQ